MSVGPPGANGTISVIGRSGYAARDTADTKHRTSAAAAVSSAERTSRRFAFRLRRDRMNPMLRSLPAISLC